MFSYKIILIGLIDSFTDYWSNINATESVERYRSMSATCWSRWHLLVCTSKYSYISIKRKFKAFQKIVFLVFIHNPSTNFIRVGAFFFFLHFSFVFFIQIYIYDKVLNFSLFYIYLWSSAKKFSNITMLQSWIEWCLSLVRIEKVYLTLQLYRWNSLFPRWSRLWEMCMIAWETRSRRWLEVRPWGESTKTWSATVSSACQTFSIHR